MKSIRLKARIGLISLLFLALSIASCGKQPNPENGPSTTDFKITGVALPSQITVSKGETVIFPGKGFVEGDIIIFTGGGEIEMPVSVPDEKHFSFVISDNLTSGPYKVSARRGTTTKSLGTTNVSLIVNVDIPDKESYSVKGMVYCDGSGVKDVLVSDGVEFASTDENGFYYLNSAKKHGYVFVVTPSGYEPACEGVIPKTFAYLGEAATVSERVDFELFKAAKDQTNHRMLVFGDMHLANRNDDRSQFTTFVKDVNSLLAESTTPVYAVTLGDMTWDLYWYDNLYEFSNYLIDVNKIQGLPIYHTIGNHDHEMGQAGDYPIGDFDTVVKYKRALGPTYYSFNIGKVHYIVMDDIRCTNDGSGKRTYNEELVDEQIQWIRKDLSYVPKSTTVIVTGHAPLWNPNGSNNLTNTDTVVSLFQGYQNVEFFTGHSHIIANNDKGWIYDHNAGAVCATWWWTGKLSGNHIATDGAPGGYMIVDLKGGEPSWQFKATGFPVDYQFRSYDRNEIEITAAKYAPKANDTYRAEFEKYNGTFASKSTANEVYINVFNYDPSWKVEVSEGDKPLSVSRVIVRDPLHIISYTASRCNSNATVSFGTGNCYHMFKTVASSATSTLEIKVTDQFGNVYTETMARPKEFSLNNYK